MICFQRLTHLNVSPLNSLRSTNIISILFEKGTVFIAFRFCVEIAACFVLAFNKLEWLCTYTEYLSVSYMLCIFISFLFSTNLKGENSQKYPAWGIGLYKSKEPQDLLYSLERRADGNMIHSHEHRYCQKVGLQVGGLSQVNCMSKGRN